MCDVTKHLEQPLDQKPIGRARSLRTTEVTEKISNLGSKIKNEKIYQFTKNYGKNWLHILACLFTDKVPVGKQK